MRAVLQPKIVLCALVGPNSHGYDKVQDIIVIISCIQKDETKKIIIHEILTFIFVMFGKCFVVRSLNC